MKSIAGSLKLELAQFREVEAFVSFASDLEATTLRTLARGVRLVEILKQKQFSPLTVQQQVVLLFAGLQGYLDEVELSKIAEVKNTLVSLSQDDNSEIKIDSNEAVKGESLAALKNFVIKHISH